jgi:hypothetical protein
MHWAPADGYDGVALAGLVVVNVRDDDGRSRGDRFLKEVARIRQDPDVFKDVVGRGGHRVPVTAVVADLSKAKDMGLKKAVARVRRAIRAAVDQ